MPDTRKNKNKIQKGGFPNENTIKTSRLLIVNNALEAVTFASANLFAAPEWVVVCNSGERDGGEHLFYKTMSIMGVFDYHYGFGNNYQTLRDLAKTEWCLLATTNNDSEFIKILHDIFNQDPTVITVHDKELPAKLNRFKTVVTKQVESLFQKEELQNISQTGGVLESSVVQSIQSQLQPEVFAEFLTRESFTIKQILKKMNEPVEVVDGNKKYATYSHILYLPETCSDKNIELLKSALPYTTNMDMVFVDRRPNPVVAEQYFYSIDLTQPIILRSNDKTRKFIALLNNIDDLEVIFKQGYQFLSTLRICPLNMVESSLQQGGQINEEYDEFGFEEDEYSQMASKPLQSFFGITDVPKEQSEEQAVQTAGGNKKYRKTLKNTRRKGPANITN
jgi:hypothetical protein